MLREYQTLGGPTFKVIRDGKRFHVLPLAAKDAAGRSSPQESILDTVITVPAAPRDGVELLQSVCDEIQKQTGFEIGIGPSAQSCTIPVLGALGSAPSSPLTYKPPSSPPSIPQTQKGCHWMSAKTSSSLLLSSTDRGSL